MRTYGLSPPPGLRLARVAGLATEAGGTASLRQTVREDGSPGVPILDVTVPDGVTPETVEGWVAEATGVSDAEQAAWEAERLAREAAERILAPSTPTEKGVEASMLGLIVAVNQLTARVNTLSAAASPSLPPLDLIDPAAARQYAAALAAGLSPMAREGE